MFKRVMIGLFAISVVAMLWTEAKAQCPFDFTYCFDVGGSTICGCYNEGSIKASGFITCDPNLGTCLQGPFKYQVEIFGNEPTLNSGACGSNPQCDMKDVTITCNGGPPHVTTLEAGIDVNFPLLGTANCKKGTCDIGSGPVDCQICETDINLKNCQGQSNVPNCCFGPHCICSPGQKIDLKPDSPGAFNVTATYSQPPPKAGPTSIQISSDDCSWVGIPPNRQSCCVTNNCTTVGGGEPSCTTVSECGD